MPRYDDRHGNNRLYVGHLSSRTRTRDLEKLFSRYGRVRDVDMKNDFAFVEFGDPRDADDARYSLDGREFEGRRIVVEFSRGVPRSSRDRDLVGRGPPPGSGRCFNCGLDGHWARDCKAGDWKNKCYRCGERGHIERQCKNSPKDLKRADSHSRSPVRSRSPHRGRSRSRSYSRERSYSRSRSPVRRARSYDRDDGSRSPKPRHSPEREKSRKRSLTPEDRSPQKDEEMNGSPKGKRGRSLTPERESPAGRRDRSPEETNGRSPSPKGSPGNKEDRSPVEDDEEDTRRSPRGSETP